MHIGTQLSWYDGSGTEITGDKVENTTEMLADGKRFTVKSTLRLHAQSEHHNAVLTCRAKSAAETMVKSAEIKVEVTMAAESMAFNGALLTCAVGRLLHA